MDSDSDDYSSSQGEHTDIFAFVRAEVDDSVDPPGLKCELTTYDARYNAKGERIRLAASKKKEVLANRPKDHDSALVLTRYYDHDKVLDFTLLEIRSPHVKAALRKVILMYPGVNLHANKVTIRGIPRCLFHYRQELGMYGGTLKDQEAVKHLLFALRYMYDTLRDEVSSYYNLMESPNIEPGLPFLNLWMAFRPGDHIYVKSNGVDRVYRFLSMDRCECFIPHCRQSKWALSLEEIDYDGSDFGHTKVTGYIDPYEGHVPLKYLRAFPLKYHPNRNDITAAMIARGQSSSPYVECTIWATMASQKHSHLQGTILFWEKMMNSRFSLFPYVAFILENSNMLISSRSKAGSWLMPRLSRPKGPLINPISVHSPSQLIPRATIT